MMKKVLMPLPARDFDPTEAAVTWRVLSEAGHEVFFATPDGRPARADPLMLSGEGLDLWGAIPGLKKIKFPRPSWVVRDGQYLSARWPGDVHRFSKRFVAMLGGSV